jgi:hypothetical protein
MRENEILGATEIMGKMTNAYKNFCRKSRKEETTWAT